MKSKTSCLALLVSLFAFHSPAFSGSDLSEPHTLIENGSFETTFEIPLLGLTKKECLKNEGRWEDGACWTEASNLVQISDLTVDPKTDYMSNFKKVYIYTVGINAHFCEFEAPAQVIDPNHMVSYVKVENDYPDGPKQELCRVELNYDKNTEELDVVANYKCLQFCAVGSFLDTKVKRVELKR
ncbi:MAG: hypothetical protein KDD25_10200 [Bdellovibrionales bacterium]|nr:hypothetical protein [Bdellovibrionales bacterium]